MPDELFQLVIPWLKLHPWALYALALGMAVSWGWSAAPKAAKAWVRAIRWGIGPRAAGLLDALVAATPTAPNVVRAIWHGVVMGRSKPERMTRAELDALIARELARVTPVPLLSRRVAEPVVIEDDTAPSAVAVPTEPGTSGR